MMNIHKFDVVYFQTLEDPVQLTRLQFVIDGHVDDNGTQYEGLLGKCPHSMVYVSMAEYQLEWWALSLAYSFLRCYSSLVTVHLR